MLTHLKIRGFEMGLDDVDLAILELEIDNWPITGACGLRVPVEKLQAFVDRIDPDYFQDEVYIPGMPIDLKRIRIV